MIQHLTAQQQDRLDDYKREEILIRATLGPLRRVRPDAPESEKAQARQEAQEGFYRTLLRHPSLTEEMS